MTGTWERARVAAPRERGSALPWVRAVRRSSSVQGVMDGERRETAHGFHVAGAYTRTGRGFAKSRCADISIVSTALQPHARLAIAQLPNEYSIVSRDIDHVRCAADRT
jgi:hypothetical protein